MGKWMYKHHLSCQHFTDLSLMAADRPLSLRERIRYVAHFFACSVCRKFTKQIKVLRHLVKLHVADLAKTSPSEEFLRRLRENLAKERTPHHPSSDSELRKNSDG